MRTEGQPNSAGLYHSWSRAACPLLLFLACLVITTGTHTVQRHTGGTQRRGSDGGVDRQGRGAQARTLTHDQRIRRRDPDQPSSIRTQHHKQRRAQSTRDAAHAHTATGTAPKPHTSRGTGAQPVPRPRTRRRRGRARTGVRRAARNSSTRRTAAHQAPCKCSSRLARSARPPIHRQVDRRRSAMRLRAATRLRTCALRSANHASPRSPMSMRWALLRARRHIHRAQSEV